MSVNVPDSMACKQHGRPSKVTMGYSLESSHDSGYKYCEVLSNIVGHNGTIQVDFSNGVTGPFGNADQAFLVYAGPVYYQSGRLNKPQPTSRKDFDDI